MRASRVIPLPLLGGVAVIALIPVAARVTGTDPGLFTRDATVQTADLPFYAGSVSVLTAVVWGAVAALSLFVAAVGPQSWRTPLRVLGAFTLFGLADDVLMFHDEVGPYLGLPYSDPVFYAMYAGFAFVLLWLMRRRLRSGAAVAFLLGGALLGGSVLVDLVLDGEAGWVYLLEDGLKLLGVCAWLAVPVLAHGDTRTGAGAARRSDAVEGPALPAGTSAEGDRPTLAA